MAGEESLVGSEAWEDIANSGEHFNEFIEVFAELTLDLSGNLDQYRRRQSRLRILDYVHGVGL